MPAWTLRSIRSEDDAAVAAIIRSVMPEFGASGPGFALHDPEVAAMSEAYAQPGSAYFVVEYRGEVCGGAGYGRLAGTRAGDREPFPGVPGPVCELRKMYFLPQLRGLGAGRALLAHCLAAAAADGYRSCYLETLDGMQAAARLYRAAGFVPLEHPLGNTGHYGCDRFYLRRLDAADRARALLAAR